MKYILLLALVSCAFGRPKSQMDYENDKGGRVTKLFYGIGDTSADKEVITRMETKCPKGYKITGKGKRPFTLGFMHSEVDFTDFECM